MTLNQKLRHPANDPARRDAWRKSISEASIGKKIRRKESLEEAFWSRVNKSSALGCWEWTKGTALGYGVFTYARTKYKCHRLAYELTFGPIRDDKHCLHRCDNRRCVRPDHLFLGTNADNVADKVRKNRQKGCPGDTNPSRTRPECLRPPLGEKHGMAKLTLEQVLEIRRLFAAGDVRKADLARRFNVSFTAIKNIVERKRWKHV